MTDEPYLSPTCNFWLKIVIAFADLYLELITLYIFFMGFVQGAYSFRDLQML